MNTHIPQYKKKSKMMSMVASSGNQIQMITFNLLSDVNISKDAT